MSKPIFFDGDLDRFWNSLINGTEVSYVNSNFPPVDIVIDDDKNLYFSFALAGYKKDEIDVRFSGDYMVLNINPESDKHELKKGNKYLNKGIKSGKSKTKYYVPYQRYDTDKVTASYEDGILNVTIPSKTPEKARSVFIK